MENTKPLSGNEALIHLAKKSNTMQAESQGDLAVISNIDGKDIKGLLTDVLYVPEAKHNLRAPTQFMQNGLTFTGADGVCTVTNSGGEQILNGRIKRGQILINLRGRERELRASVASTAVLEAGKLWHGQFGHMTGKYVKQLSKLCTRTPEKLKVRKNMTTCDICAAAKLKKLKHSETRRILERVHIDLMGLITPMAEDGSEYVLVLVDDWSHYTVIYCIPSKDEAFQQIQEYVYAVNNKHQSKIAEIRCDGGKEFVQSKMEEFCRYEGIQIDTTPPATPELNSTVERMNRTLAN
jgi:hypothetical protein